MVPEASQQPGTEQAPLSHCCLVLGRSRYLHRRSRREVTWTHQRPASSPLKIPGMCSHDWTAFPEVPNQELPDYLGHGNLLGNPFRHRVRLTEEERPGKPRSSLYQMLRKPSATQAGEPRPAVGPQVRAPPPLRCLASGDPDGADPIIERVF